MIRWFRFNGDFEYELAAWPGPYQQTRFARLLNRQIAPTMALLGDEQDRVLDEALPTGAPSEDETAPGTVRYVPWGVTPSILAEAARIDPTQRFPSVEVVRRVQDRQFSLELEHALGVALPGSRVLRSMDALKAAVRDATGPFVIKHPFGVAGRERVLSRPVGLDLSEGAWTWCSRALEQAGALAYEPWVARVREYGVQWSIPESGAPTLLGVVELLTDPGGTYRGHRLGHIRWPAELETLTREIARRVQAEGYFGPLGIDAFEYRLPDGTVRLRPLVELNARHTMGMCALGLRRYIPPGAVGTWIHHDASGGVPVEVARALEQNPYDPRRRLGVRVTSPLEIQGSRATRLSVLTIEPAPEVGDPSV